MAGLGECPPWRVGASRCRTAGKQHTNKAADVRQPYLKGDRIMRYEVFPANGVPLYVVRRRWLARLLAWWHRMDWAEEGCGWMV